MAWGYALGKSDQVGSQVAGGTQEEKILMAPWSTRPALGQLFPSDQARWLDRIFRSRRSAFCQGRGSRPGSRLARALPQAGFSLWVSAATSHVALKSCQTQSPKCRSALHFFRWVQGKQQVHINESKQTSKQQERGWKANIFHKALHILNDRVWGLTIPGLDRILFKNRG